jgi:hypothetical protein
MLQTTRIPERKARIYEYEIDAVGPLSRTRRSGAHLVGFGDVAIRGITFTRVSQWHSLRTKFLSVDSHVHFF